MTFGFSLYVMFLLVILVIYFERDTQDITSKQVYWNIRGMSLLTLEVGNSFSWFSEYVMT